jgi:uncharacterized protein YwqG
MKETLKKLISEHNLNHIAGPILAAATTGLRIIKQPSRDDFLGTSRLGGSPDVRPDFVWPVRDGRSLGFLAQINCSEVAAHDSEHALPDSGVLYFFYDIQEQPWGFDPKDRGGAIVLYAPTGPLEAAPSPSDLDTEAILPVVPVGFRAFLSIPCYDSAACDSLALADGDSDSYFELYDAVTSEAFGGQPKHQLLGYSNNVQGDMQLECQLVFNSLYCGDATGYNDPKAKQLEAGASDWRLLLQFDSDDDLNIMWGDCGIVYFSIRNEDLRQRAFKSTWTILQCS